MKKVKSTMEFVGFLLIMLAIGAGDSECLLIPILMLVIGVTLYYFGTKGNAGSEKEME